MKQRDRRMAPALAVAAELRRQIYAGEYADQEWLPSERELSLRLGVHRTYIRAALHELGDEGLLILKARCRPVVNNPGMARMGDTPALGSTRKAAASRLIALVMWSFAIADGGTPQEQIFFGMSDVLTDAGYHCVFLNLGNRFGSSEQNADLEAGLLRQAIDSGMEGVVFYANAYDRNRSLMREVAHRMPLIFIDRMPTGIEADYVGIDNFDAVYRLTNHVLDLGHKRIVYVTGDEAINTVGDRLRGFRRALRDRLGATAPDMIVSGTGMTSSWSAFEALFRVSPDKRPTAVICVNDVEARHAALRLAEFGLSIPDDVSLAGFDNVVKTLPNGIGLTTVEQPFRRIGESAAELLLHRIAEPTAPISSVECRSTLMPRDSTCAPR